MYMYHKSRGVEIPLGQPYSGNSKYKINILKIIDTENWRIRYEVCRNRRLETFRKTNSQDHE